MTEEKNQAGLQSSPEQDGRKQNFSGLWRKFFVATTVLVLCFAIPLFKLLRFSVGSELYSHIPLIPLISGYLIWSQKKTWPETFRPAPLLGGVFFAGGLIVLITWFAARIPAGAPEDQLAPAIFSFLLFLIGIVCLFLGREFLSTFSFPLALLVFVIPFPAFLCGWIDAFLQHGSAWVASGLFTLSALPFFRDGIVFRLPGITIQVATECSGIHSTLALFITSLLAGYIFLRRPWSRATLALAVIPLALLRNGFRIFVIGQLCAQIGPEMINSPIHRRGGPLFFALSLIPFFLLLIFLIKSERRKSRSAV